jgi:hypothetical protein
MRPGSGEPVAVLCILVSIDWNKTFWILFRCSPTIFVTVPVIYEFSDDVTRRTGHTSKTLQTGGSADTCTCGNIIGWYCAGSFYFQQQVPGSKKESHQEKHERPKYQCPENSPKIP